MPDGQPRADEVSEALQRLLAWPDIARSGQLARFLAYIVERKLRGEAQSIKAYSIAVDVLGRSPDFDPQSDPIVRVQARRLRGLIGQYYREQGAGEDVRIELPTGRYVPEFVRWSGAVSASAKADAGTHPDAPPILSKPPGGLPATWFFLAVATVGAAILAYAYSMWSAQNEMGAQPVGLIDPPSVLVTEFQSLGGDMSDPGRAAGLAIELLTDLEQFEMMSVRYGGGATSVGMDNTSEYVLSGIVRREAGGLQYSAILTEVATGSVVWNRAIALDAGELGRGDLVDYVFDTFSRVLASPRGPLHRRARALLNENASIAGGENLYLCRVLFDLYRERGTLSAGERAQRCFNALGELERNAGQAKAAMASLSIEGVPSGPTLDLTQDERVALAAILLEQAIELAPISAFVWEQRGRYFELVGEHDAAEAAYSSALQINPASTDIMAVRARHLAFLGLHASAERLAARAIDDVPDPPAWYFAVPTLKALREGDFQQAVDYAEIYAEADRELGPILAVMAGQGLHDTNIVNRYLSRVLDLASFRSQGVLTQLRSRIGDENLLRNIRVALLSAGLPPAALNGPF